MTVCSLNIKGTDLAYKRLESYGSRGLLQEHSTIFTKARYGSLQKQVNCNVNYTENKLEGKYLLSDAVTMPLLIDPKHKNTIKCYTVSNYSLWAVTSSVGYPA